MLRIYEYDNTMSGQREWVVEDTYLNRDVKSFSGPFASFRAKLYIALRKHRKNP